MHTRSRSINTLIFILAACLVFSLTFLVLPLSGRDGSVALAEPGSGWEVQEVDFGRAFVSAISAVDAENLWAVGYDVGSSENVGFILKTGDGGEHWAYQGPEDLAKLVDVCAVDANTAWAVGGSFPGPASTNALILKTDDGGNTWNVQKQENGYALMGISALNADIALAAGGKITFEYLQLKKSGVLLGTVDGGKTWTTLLTKEGDLFEDVAIVDMKTAWVLGEQALKTSDGGFTWEVKHTHASSYLNKKISVAGSETVWISAPDLIARSTDGGGSWETVSPDTGNSFYNDVDAVDANVAWVTSGGGSYDVTGTLAIFRTLDGGDTWERFDMSMPQLAACAIDANTMWASGIAIYKTSDGGGTWSLQGPETDRDLFSISAMDSEVAAAVGESGTIAYPAPDTGGFLVWAGPFINYSVSSDLRSICMLAPPKILFDPGDIWVAGTGGIIVRINETQATAFQDPGTDNDLLGLSAVDGSIAWAVGQGVITKTFDGGSTWIVQLEIPLKINDVSAVDVSTAWAVADGGIIGKTINGTAWSAQASGTTANLNGVCAVDVSTAWAVGAGGTILKTIDGTAWSAQASGTAANLYSVCAVDSSTAWAVGAGGIILKTGDGGTTWLRQDSQTANDLHDVCAVDADVAWAAGEHLTILKTSDGGGPGVAFSVSSITPGSAAQFTWAMNFQVSGTGFVPGAVVRLEKGAVVLNAYDVKVAAANQITCTAGLFWAEPGAYDVVVTNPDGQEARLPGGFTVTSPCGSGSGTALLMLGLTLGLLSLAGTVRFRRRGNV